MLRERNSVQVDGACTAGGRDLGVALLVMSRGGVADARPACAGSHAVVDVRVVVVPAHAWRQIGTDRAFLGAPCSLTVHQE